MKTIRILLASFCLAQSAAAENPSAPPQAEIKPVVISDHQQSRQDNYHWLRDDTRKNPQVMNYLQAENQYAAAQMQKWQPLREEIYQEMRAGQEEDRYTQPHQNGEYTYQIRWPDKAEYPLLTRRKTGDAREETVLDQRQRSAGQRFYQLVGYRVSDDNRYLAIAEDTRGDGQARISIRDMQRQRWLSTRIDNTSGDMVFAPDGGRLFYVLNHPQTLTPWQVNLHRLDASGPDRKIYRESQGGFYTGLSRSASDQYLLITLSGNETSEVRVLPFARDSDPSRPLKPRVAGQEYYADHVNDRFYLRSNALNKHFGIYVADKVDSPWQALIAPDEATDIEAFVLLRRWLITAERHNGKLQFARRDFDSGQRQLLQFPDDSYMARLGNNDNSHATSLNYLYSSLNTPLGYYQWDLEKNQRVLVQQKTVPGVDLTAYHSRYLEIPVRDGARVPVSLVYRKDLFRPGKNPLLVYGYGAYGFSLDAAFSAPRVSLLDRGFIFALVHVRGGGEKGVNWYLQGKRQQKQNSFNDLIDASRGLTAQGLGDRTRLYGMGGSAGGLLLAAAVNQAPELFRAVVLQVPFVDVLNTLSDPTLPLTVQEYDEWGNPADKAAYQLIKSYSPYDNLTAHAYPDMLVTAGLNDAQVAYWEAAKYIARLRALKTNPDSLQLLITTMNAGHHGQSGRSSRLKASADAFSFFIFINNKNQ